MGHATATGFAGCVALCALLCIERSLLIASGLLCQWDKHLSQALEFSELLRCQCHVDLDGDIGSIMPSQDSLGNDHQLGTHPAPDSICVLRHLTHSRKACTASSSSTGAFGFAMISNRFAQYVVCTPPMWVIFS